MTNMLDFIGQANRKYNFEEKFAALLANTTHSVQYELKHGFISAPKGCYIQLEKKAEKAILDNIYSLADSPIMQAELMELLQYKYDHIDFIDRPVDLGFDCPLDLYCTYTHDQLLVAMDFMNPNSVREGVKWLPEKQIDVLFVTLNKSDKDYSPTTMYNDYSINETLFHWQSQSTTTDTGSVGQRYINYRKRGSKVLLFVLEFKNDTAGRSRRRSMKSRKAIPPGGRF